MLPGHDGYSPEQIVLGRSLAVPGSICSDENVASHAMAIGSDLEAEAHRQRLDLRCRARCAFLHADNSAAIRRASLRRSNPTRGPYHQGSWVLYWVQKSAPDRLSAGKWHGAAKVIVQEGASIVWVSHGTKVVRCSPENLRPASHREYLAMGPAEDSPSVQPVGGASSMLDLTHQSRPDQDASRSLPGGVSASPSPVMVDVLVPGAIVTTNPELAVAPRSNTPEDIVQPEQEMTPQVSSQIPTTGTSGVELVQQPAGLGAPSESEVPVPTSVHSGLPSTSVAENTPLPQDDNTDLELADDNICEQILLATEEAGVNDLFHFTALAASPCAACPPLAEDDMPFVTDPLCCAEHQAFCLEVPLKSSDVRKWRQEAAPEQMAAVASAGKRARAEACLKDLTLREVALFDEAKRKEIQCWIQTSAIRAILRRKLNPDQILRSRWVLTWKTPEPN